MEARILKFYGSEIVARYYLNLGNFSIKETKDIIEEIFQQDSQSRFITSAEYMFSFSDRFGYEVTYQKELSLPHNVKRCNENLENIWKALNHISKQNDSKHLVIELSYRKLRNNVSV